MDPGSRGLAVPPISAERLSAIARRHDVDEDELREALVAIHDDLADGADAIHEHYASTGDAPEPITVADGLASAIYVDVAQWERTTATLPDDLRTAAKAAHAAIASEQEAGATTADGVSPLVMPSATVGRLVRSGLSRRQAEVQVLGTAGIADDEIADRLGIDESTVRVHRHRIETKVENAKRLLASVGG